MNIRGILTSAAAVVTVAGAAFAGPAAAAVSGSAGPGSTAGTTSATGTGPHAAFSTNLHAEYARLSGHTTMRPRSGIVPPRGTHVTGNPNTKPAAAPAGGSCTEPNCNLTYNGGPVQHTPLIYVVFWGPNWTNATTQMPAAENYLLSLYQGLGATGDIWSLTNSQYSDGSGHPVFTKGVLVKWGIDTSTPPSEVQESDVATEAAAAATTFGITDVPDAQVIVAFQSGTCFADGFAGSSCTPVPPHYCAWHSSTPYNSGNLSFTNLPFLLDAGANCGQDFINAGARGTMDGFSIVGGHEYAESVTDPVPGTGYIDLSDNVSGGEIGDKCAWAGEIWGTPDPAGDVTLATGSFAMQSLWSNAAGRCVMAGTPVGQVTGPWGKCLDNAGGKTTGGNKIDIATCNGIAEQMITYTPGGQLQVQGGCITGGLAAVFFEPCSGATNKLWYRLGSEYVNKWTGKCLSDPGISKVNGTQLTVTTCGNRVYQHWNLPATQAVAGLVTGPWGKCVDNAGGKTTGGNKIDIATCNGNSQQTITYTPGGLLRVQGGCITGGKATVFFEPCSGATNKLWYRLGSEYVNGWTGGCLTDPGLSKTNGTQLTVALCVGRVYQQWTLP